MSKQIRRNKQIYVAPKMLGKYENENPVVIDEINNETLNPRNVDHKIRIFRREVEEWFLKPARDLLNADSFRNSFLVLMVCMAYLEGIEQYKTGVSSNRRSKECFVDSVNRLFPGQYSENDLGKLYMKSRCGLFHNGMVKGGVVFNNESFEDALRFEENGELIKINPRLLLNKIEEDFESFINELSNVHSNNHVNDNATVRDNFDRMFSIL